MRILGSTYQCNVAIIPCFHYCRFFFIDSCFFAFCSFFLKTKLFQKHEIIRCCKSRRCSLMFNNFMIFWRFVSCVRVCETMSPEEKLILVSAARCYWCYFCKFNLRTCRIRDCDIKKEKRKKTPAKLNCSSNEKKNEQKTIERLVFAFKRIAYDI